MKRYSIGVKSVRSNKMETDHNGNPILIVRVVTTMDENQTNGDWVKYEDVMGTVQCNCYEYSMVKMGKSCVGIGWVCPAHGYKEKLNLETKMNIVFLLM